MRERNNEASKRCRLKRRMKAVSTENQSSMLNMANKMLKQRIQRLEQVGSALKEGVKKIQSGQCACDLTRGIIRQTNRDYFDPDPQTGKDSTSFELISKSRSIRENNGINFILNQGADPEHYIHVDNYPPQQQQTQQQQQQNNVLGFTGNSCSSEEDPLTNPSSPTLSMTRTEMSAPSPQIQYQPQQQRYYGNLGFRSYQFLHRTEATKFSKIFRFVFFYDLFDILYNAFDFEVIEICYCPS